jgi:predicted CXXCH cytochrome family protein
MKANYKHLPVSILLAFCILCLLIVARPAYPQEDFKLQPGAEGKICLKCHETFQQTLKSRAVHQPLKTGKCADCHDPHTSAHKNLLTSDINALCNGCHQELLPQKARSTHKVVAAGECVKCHASHASENNFILLKAGNALCGDCHQDVGTKVKEARFKHDPLMKDKGCLNCHDPHASVKSDYLLKNVVPALCTECHKTDALSFKRKHLDYPVADTNCDSCHSAHGSNTRGILYDNVHPPVAENKCTQCHVKADAPDAKRTKKQGTELCKECHRDSVESIFTKNRVHWPLTDKTGCLNCHSPHGSRQKKLLEESVRGTCGRCHKDTVELQQWSINNPKNTNLCEPVKTGSCISCHSPHAADYLLLMPNASISNGICGKCHEWETHSTHPIGEKAIDPRDKNLTVECLSCHKACGTGNKPNMMPFETTYDLCIQCHPERRK